MTQLQLALIEQRFISDYDNAISIRNNVVTTQEAPSLIGAQFAFDSYNAVQIRVQESNTGLRVTHVGVLTNGAAISDEIVSVLQEMILTDPVSQLRYRVAWLRIGPTCIGAVVSGALGAEDRPYPSGALLICEDEARADGEENHWWAHYTSTLQQIKFDARNLPGGFGRGALVQGENRPLAVENLAVGDLVWTDGDGLARVEWIDVVPATIPSVFIPKGVLGNDNDMYLGPQHRILLRSARLQHRMGLPEGLVIAKYLVGWRGVTFFETSPVHLYHILLEKHAIMMVNGALVESLATKELLRQAALGDGSLTLKDTINTLGKEAPDYCKPVLKTYEIADLF